MQLIVRNIGELITLAPLSKQDQPSRITQDHLGLKNDAWLSLEEGRIKDYGVGEPPASYQNWPVIDAGACLVTPGLVDCHTHPIFGGDRSNEFAQRLDGVSYQDIAAAGGGIKSSIQQTRQASDQELLDICLRHLKSFLRHGVTTVECKSGYGQNPQQELRLLRLLNQVKGQVPQALSITYLGLHAASDEFSSKYEFIRNMTDTLDTIATESLATWVDAFVEKGYFEVEECRSYIKKAQALGLGIRIHADEFAASGAAAASAEWGAASADHLEEADDEGIAAMSSKGVIAVLLPGTSLYSKIKYAQGQRFLNAGCQVALATDFNPGSCLLNNLPQIASLGALYCGLNPAEAIAAITFVAAKALKLHQTKGHLSIGADADFLIHKHQTKEQWLADFGCHTPTKVFIGGEQQDI